MFYETKEKQQLQDVMRDYSIQIKETGQDNCTGAVLMAVCRGNFSEGVDFTDDEARAVIILGQPNQNWVDPKLQLQLKFLEEKKRIQTDEYFKKISLSGSDFYNQQTQRAVNQSAGRVIRHIKDYGVVIYADYRFKLPHNFNSMPDWMKPVVQKEHTSLSEIGTAIDKFFDQIKA